MPKFLGMEPKTWLWIGGGLAVVLVLYYVTKAKSGDAGGIPAGSPDFGPTGPSAPPSYQPGVPDSAGDQYASELQRLELEAFAEDQRQQRAMFELQYEGGKQQLGLWGAQQSLAFEAARREQGFALGFAEEQYRTAQAAQEVVTRSVKGKKKVECPPGMHLVVLPDGSAACQQKGGGGFSLRTVFEGIGNIAEGLFGGAAAAAPGIGYGAAQAFAARQGAFSLGSAAPQQRRTSQAYRTSYTPTFSPQPIRGLPQPYGAVDIYMDSRGRIV